MRGTSHMIVGAATGGALVYYGGDFTNVEAASIIATCSIASLIPDLDTNGKLTNKITIPVRLVTSLLFFLGVSLIIYSYANASGSDVWIGMGIGAALLVLPRFFIKRKTMLIVTGFCVLALGVNLFELWILGLGAYILICAFLPHRGLTHSIFGLLFFSWIAFEFQKTIAIEGIMNAAVLGYFSHLITDMKWVPFNRKGVKLFQPLLNKEF